MVLFALPLRLTVTLGDLFQSLCFVFSLTAMCGGTTSNAGSHPLGVFHLFVFFLHNLFKVGLGTRGLSPVGLHCFLFRVVMRFLCKVKETTRGDPFPRFGVGDRVREKHGPSQAGVVIIATVVIRRPVESPGCHSTTDSGASSVKALSRQCQVW